VEGRYFSGQGGSPSKKNSLPTSKEPARSGALRKTRVHSDGGKVTVKGKGGEAIGENLVDHEIGGDQLGTDLEDQVRRGVKIKKGGDVSRFHRGSEGSCIRLEKRFEFR